MKTLERFLHEYRPWVADTSGDTRGVLSCDTDRRAYINYAWFKKDILALEDFPVLVYYYHHKNKHYSWRPASGFPYCEEHGPGPDKKPWIIKRDPRTWFEAVPAPSLLCFSVMRWNFEHSVMVACYVTWERLAAEGFEQGGLYKRKEVADSLWKLFSGG